MTDDARTCGLQRSGSVQKLYGAGQASVRQGPCHAGLQINASRCVLACIFNQELQRLPLEGNRCLNLQACLIVAILISHMGPCYKDEAQYLMKHYFTHITSDFDSSSREAKGRPGLIMHCLLVARSQDSHHSL